ncbi:PTS sugar transporter subunit IIB [Longimicrobium sp.]|uniref:PTS system mannose/fructose/N-acetylgalactosamine-transporter subunit IIB n=1 Tax=Longimicrobium sp. TaxID=2029185 RepID=UPI002CEEA2EB|nr:PTS sugar transporter subunit IIB [Longimicrobium sp.]HSU14984.1 PTS sugar transporter subunit IIB [Longimicrobium sp.]
MPIVLFRVDERLIHGQVVVGWGGPLHADRIVVVDDDLAASPWEQELYCLGVPPEIEARFLSVATARGDLPAWKAEHKRTIVLVRDVATAARMAEGGLLAGEEVNLGGIHHAEGRARILSYLHLRPEERGQLDVIAAGGAEVSARDLPASKKVPLKELTPG